VLTKEVKWLEVAWAYLSATALKPLASGRLGQGATPTPLKTIHVDLYNSRKMSCLSVQPYAAQDGILFLFLPNFTTKHTHRQANVLSTLQWRPFQLQLNDVMLTLPI